MGCDIHGQFIVRRRGKERQFHYDEPITGRVLANRSYPFFALLAGVRNYEGLTPIAKPRGFPDGIKNSEDEHPDGLDSFDYGDHSFSWVTLDELRKVAINYVEACKKLPDYGNGEPMRRAIFALCDYADAMRGEDEALFVFGFDS